jgi:hypothetical protein
MAKQIISDEAYQAMLDGFSKFEEQFDGWAHDERDGGAIQLREYVEKELERPMTEKELNSRLFKKADEQAGKIESAASDIGYQYRIGGRIGGMKAEIEFDKVKSKYPNF